MNIPVTDLVPGDVIVRTDTEITVDRVEPVLDSPAFDPAAGTEMVRIHGRITKGYGRSSKPHAWTYYTDADVDVVRANEEVWNFTPGGKARRVR